MADETPHSRNMSPAAAAASGRANFSPLGIRPLTRAATIADVSSSTPGFRRRASFMSVESMERQSLRSSTDDLLLPRVARPPSSDNIHEAPSLLYSSPLFLALLPGLAALFLKRDVGDILTDLTLLILAALFLNWSIRVPWDWYQAAQSLRTEDDQTTDSYLSPTDTILEEPEDEDNQDSQEATGSTIPPKASLKPSTEHARATRELRFHENVALVACFLGPLAGAWLLHTIRGALSRPAEGLVSDYNLTIFILASELRPLAHVLKLFQAQTIHLQRIVAMHPYAAPTPLEPSALTDLNARLDELEEHIADEKSSQPTTSPPADPSPQLLATVRKSFQPELDAISRAVRRYEKRATVLGMQMEGRMQELEYRVKDALTLAAAAERGRDGSAKILLDFVSAMVVVPATAGWAAGIWAINMPVRLLEKTKTMLPGASKSKGKARESGKRKKKDNS